MWLPPMICTGRLARSRNLPDIVIIQAGALQRPFQFGRKQPDDFLFPVHMSTSYPYYM